MARYIDADALGIGKAFRYLFTIPEYADGWNSAVEIIENAPTADVAPKSEVERLRSENADLQDALKCQVETNAHLNGEYLALMKAYESQKAEIDRLSVELEAMRGAANSYKMHYENAKREVAREIFEELDRMLLDGFIGHKYPTKIIHPDTYAELKKKYTEGSDE